MKIYETEHWEVKLNKDQAYLGRCVVVLKRENCGDLAELEKGEIIDFFKIIKDLEMAIKNAFGAEMFNWTCLMNNAYKEEIPKPHVHWHLRPRYRKPVSIKGIKFKDTEFAHHYDNKRHFEVSDDVLSEILKQIREYLK